MRRRTANTIAILAAALAPVARRWSSQNLGMSSGNVRAADFDEDKDCRFPHAGADAKYRFRILTEFETKKPAQLYDPKPVEVEEENLRNTEISPSLDPKSAAETEEIKKAFGFDYEVLIALQDRLDAIPDVFLCSMKDDPEVDPNRAKKNFEFQRLDAAARQKAFNDVTAILRELEGGEFPLDHPDVAYLQAFCLMKLLRYEEALDVMRRAFPIAPSSAPADLYAEICFRANRFDWLPAVLNDIAPEPIPEGKEFDLVRNQLQHTQHELFLAVCEVLIQTVMASILDINEGAASRNFMQSLAGVCHGFGVELTKLFLWAIFNETTQTAAMALQDKLPDGSIISQKRRDLLRSTAIVINRTLMAGQLSKLTAQPELFEAKVRLGLFLTLTSQKRLTEAIGIGESLVEYLNERKDHPDVQADMSTYADSIDLQLLEIKARLGPAKGIPLLKSYLARKPDSAQAMYLLACCQSKIDLHDDAMVTIKRAIELDPSNSASHTLHSILLEAAGRREEAARAALTAKLSYRKIFPEYELPGPKLERSDVEYTKSAVDHETTFVSPFLVDMEMSPQEQAQAEALETQEQRDLRMHYARYEIAHSYMKPRGKETMEKSDVPVKTISPTLSMVPDESAVSAEMVARYTNSK
jgi:tetratricopeptide (TPR) repeat protein